jgi:hypothetical protein
MTPERDPLGRGHALTGIPVGSRGLLTLLAAIAEPGHGGLGTDGNGRQIIWPFLSPSGGNQRFYSIGRISLELPKPSPPRLVIAAGSRA